MAFTFKHADRPLKEYEIRRAIGRGGFGEVYYAVSDGGREVALKFLHSNQDIELRGISHCMNLKSPHLVDIFDVVKNDDGDYFVIMEYVGGPSLRDLLTAEPRGLGVPKATFFLKGIAAGLSYLHDRGIVHRDLKPGNIFYEDGYVKIGDYGLSKFISQSSPGAQTASIGTVAYMAPEVGSGQYTRGIDIYALGVILYEMLLGKVPYEGQSHGEILMKHLMDQPEVDALPEPFPRVIRKALAKDPRDRYRHVDEILEEVLGTQHIRDSVAGFDTDSLTQVAARTAENLHRQPETIPVATAPDYRPFEGTSASPQLPVQELDYADPLRPTTQRQVQFAGFWIRFVAVIVDSVVLLIPSMLFRPSVLLGIAYGTLLLTYWNGQTVGKRACGIRVVDLYGQPLTLWRALARECSKILSMMTIFIGYLMAGFSRRKQALHDMIAATCVIYVDQPSARAPQPDPLQRARQAQRQKNMQRAYSLPAHDRQARHAHRIPVTSRCGCDC